MIDNDSCVNSNHADSGRRQSAAVSLRLAAACLAVLIAVAMPASSLFAQDVPADPRQEQLKAPLVDWTHAKRVHRAAERWARLGEVSSLKPSDHVPVSGVSAVRITLRMDGVTLGLGDAFDGANDNGAPVDLMQLAADAMSSALKATSRELADRHRRALVVLEEKNLSIPKGQERPLSLEDIGPRLLVDLQVGCDLEPVTLAPEADVAALLESFDAGIDGMQVTGKSVGGKSPAAKSWPANALAWNVSPESQFRSLARAVAGEKAKIEDIAKPGGLLFHKFDVIHIVRPTRVSPVYHLIRGNDPIPRTALDQATLDSVGQRMVRYILGQVRENGSVAGTYEPTSDRFEGEFAEYKSTALAIFALVNWAQQMQQRGAPEHERRALSRAIQAMSGHLAGQIVGAGVAADPPAMALLAMSIIESPVLAHQKLDRDNLVGGLLRLQNDNGSFRQSFDVRADLLRPEDQALVLAALTLHADRTRDPLAVAAVRVGRQWMWSQARAGYEEETWFWLMLAERLIDQNNLPVFMQPAKEAQRFGFMRDMAVTLRQRQVTQSGDGQSADEVGAFVRMNQITPTWHSAWSTAYLAWAVRTGLVRDDEKLRTLLASALGARFVARLMFDWPACYYVTRPDEVIGAVRGSLIDNRLSIRYTAAGLLSVVELQQTLRQLEQERLDRP